MLLCITCFNLLFVLPIVVHGENIDASTNSSKSKEDWKSRSFLFSNLKKVDNMLKDSTKSTDVDVQETVDLTKQTVIDLTKPLESKPITSSFEPTGNLLNDTVENSVPAIEKTMGIVTDTVTKTTSEVTDEVNQIVNSVVYQLPTVPIVTPVLTEVSKTVKITTSSVDAVIEKTGEFIKENGQSTIDSSKDVVVENSDPDDSEDKIMKPSREIIQKDEKAMTQEGNSNPSTTKHSNDIGFVEKRELVIPSLPAIGTTELEEHDDIGIVMNDEDNIVLNSFTEETALDQHTVVQEFSLIERENGAMEQVQNSNPDTIKKKTAYNSSHPLETSWKWGSLPSTFITVASPSTASSALSMGGQSDLFSGALVDVFTLISSSTRQWIHTDENAMVQWTHAPPGKPPKQSPF